jgi:hypothetical protein
MNNNFHPNYGQMFFIMDEYPKKIKIKIKMVNLEPKAFVRV